MKTKENQLQINGEGMRFMQGVCTTQGLHWISTCFASGTPLELHLRLHWSPVYFAKAPLMISWDAHTYCKGPLRISMYFPMFCKGCPLGFYWLSRHFTMEPLRFHFYGFHTLWKGYTLKIPPDFATFCNGHRLLFHWISLHVARGAPYKFMGFVNHFCPGTP